MSEERKSKRGPTPLAGGDLRTHCVSVRLNPAELLQLDSTRGKFLRGEWLRMSALDNLPPMIPELNRISYAELARSAANLNQIARYLNTEQAVETDEIIKILAEFRRALLGVI